MQPSVIRDAVLAATGYDLDSDDSPVDTSASDMRDAIHAKVREIGLRVDMGSDYCQRYRTIHPHNCTTCESYEGCYRSARIIEATMKYLCLVALPQNDIVDISTIATAAYMHVVADMMAPPVPSIAEQILGEK